MIIDITNWEWGASSTAVAGGVWLFFLWCWLVSRSRRRRLEMVAAFGVIVVGAVVGGWAGAMLVGEAGLSSLGGIAASAVILLFVAPPWQVEKRWLLDGLVPGGIAGLSLARMGCLWEGCDFGGLTEGPLAVVHGAGTRAWEVQVTHYELSPASAVSDPVHPFAAYLALWGLMAAVAGEWWRRRENRPGRAAMVGAIIFFAGGGAIEWLREPETVIQLADGVSAYPSLYWAGAIGAGLVWSKLDSSLVEESV